MKPILLQLCLLTPLAAANLAWDAYPSAQYFRVWNVSVEPRAQLATVYVPAATVAAAPGTRLTVSAFVTTANGVVESRMAAPVVVPFTQTITVQTSQDLVTWTTAHVYSITAGVAAIDPRPDGPWLVDDSAPIFLIEPRPAQTRFYRLKLETP